MNLQSIIQAVASVANVLSVVVLGVGYYFMIKLYREWLRQSQETRTAGGRPLIVVAADYNHLPEVNLVVRNFTQAPAKDISFEFSAPVEDPDGTVLSELPYLKEGMPFVEPGASISRPWGHLPALASLLRERGLEGGIGVTTRYKDLAGERYESEWTLQPLLFEGAGIENSKGMDDLMDAVKGLSEGETGRNGRRPRAATRTEASLDGPGREPQTRPPTGSSALSSASRASASGANTRADPKQGRMRPG